MLQVKGLHQYCQAKPRDPENFNLLLAFQVLKI